MSPAIAALIFTAGILVLFFADRARDAKTSPALWLPTIWLLLVTSRNISQWLGGSNVTTSAEEYIDGSPLDRAILTAFITAGVGVLIRRRQQTVEILRANAPLLIFLLFCAASAGWSDYPFVTFKRWTKALGAVTMVLIVLTDRDPLFSVKRFLTRAAFILIPYSVLLIKYYPELGRYYDRWEGKAFYCGVATDKNVLGALCLIFGLMLVWRMVEIVRCRGQRAGHAGAVATVLAMNLWLFYKADSATSVGCFVLGSTLILLLSISRRPRVGLVHVTVAVLVSVAVIVYVFPDAFALLVGSLGRNMTLTGRTDLWNDLRQMDTHPWLGTGFESFFLGDRLDVLWTKYWWHPNEAHNGYLEIYLTLGIVGLSLLGVLILTGYRNLVAQYRRDPHAGSIRLAFWTIALNYNLTEAAFKAMHPTWLLFLIAVSALPLKEESAVGATQAFVSNRLDAPVVSPRQWRPLHDRRARLHSRSQSPTDSPHNFRKA
jgi:exopolysaccharide production protein ExoQ